MVRTAATIDDAPAMRYLRPLLPVLISAAFVGWLMWKVPLGRLAEAASHLRWTLLAPATAAMVLAQFLLDGLCMLPTYGTDRQRVRYGDALSARAGSYLVSALNHALGQAMLAWHFSRIQRMSFVEALSRGVLLLYHDGLVLALAGLAGASLGRVPQAAKMQAFCAVLLGLLIAGIVFLAVVPARWRRWFQRTRFGAWLGSWSLQRSLQLLVLRTVYYAVLGLYVGAALRISGLHFYAADVAGAISVVLVVVTIPSISGLGPRELALVELLGPENGDVLGAVGLLWSAGLIIGRLTIGLAHLWLCGPVVGPSAGPLHASPGLEPPGD
jgi:hypothetical protein